MYHVSAQGIDERMINVHYYYYNAQYMDDCYYTMNYSSSAVGPVWIFVFVLVLNVQILDIQHHYEHVQIYTISPI